MKGVGDMSVRPQETREAGARGARSIFHALRWLRSEVDAWLTQRASERGEGQS